MSMLSWKKSAARFFDKQSKIPRTATEDSPSKGSWFGLFCGILSPSFVSSWIVGEKGGAV